MAETVNFADKGRFVVLESNLGPAYVGHSERSAKFSCVCLIASSINLCPVPKYTLAHSHELLVPVNIVSYDTAVNFHYKTIVPKTCSFETLEEAMNKYLQLIHLHLTYPAYGLVNVYDTRCIYKISPTNDSFIFIGSCYNLTSRFMLYLLQRYEELHTKVNLLETMLSYQPNGIEPKKQNHIFIL